jgi:hypothetical protein
MDRSASQPTVLKEKTADNPDLSAICLSDLSDLSASRSEGDLDLPDSLRRCSQCNTPGDARGAVLPYGNNGKQVWLHTVCVRFWEKGQGKEDAWPWESR